MLRLAFLVLIVAVLLSAGYYYAAKHHLNLATPPSSSSVPVNIGQRTKTSSCQAVNALQDHACTPGAADASLTKDVLCSSSFSTKSVRNVPSQEKTAVYQEYGIASHRPGEYEVDHLVSLELGGSNDIANLWPEAAEPRPGYHEKDVVENYLHKQVCSGTLSLPDAQAQIATDWLSVYKSIPNTSSYHR